MAGFLRQLQRSKGPKPQEAREAVVRSSSHDEELSDHDDEFLLKTGFEVGGARDASGVQRLPGSGDSNEAASNERAAPGSSAGAPPTRRASADETPWWFLETLERNPQVDQLIARVVPLLDGATLIPGPELRPHLEAIVAQTAAGLKAEIRVTRKLVEQVELELQQLVDGYGPLDPLFEDPFVTEIFIDGHRLIRVVRAGHAAETPFTFRSPEEYRLFTDSVLRRLQRSIDADHPIAEGVLTDRWRARCSILHSSISEGGEHRIAIRIGRLHATSFFDMLQQKALSATVAAWLAELVAMAEANILVTGPKRQGRSLLASALASAVGSDERMVLLESTPMISMTSAHVERVFPTAGTTGATVAALLDAAQRRSPHRLMIGDIVGGDALAVIRALEAGCRGSIFTFPADSAEESLLCLLDACLEQTMAPVESLVRRLSRTVQIIVSTREIDGQSCLDTIAEVLPPHGGSFRLRPLLRYHGVANGKRQWQLLTKQSKWITAVKERGAMLAPGPGLLPPPPESRAVELREEQTLGVGDRGSTGGER